ncbi:hypothetical protein MNBD_GAMMA12-248 [hydrothermal vent metagenome]|uniref:BatD n=1 Tax=hydrothermal vent metagenome TaxID=652676 RepID=A0A3B0Y8J2_9ZZZZ
MAAVTAPNLYCSLSNNKPWLRQQVLLVCEFYTERSFMEIEHVELKVPWALTYKIPLQQSGVRRHGKQVYYHRFGWVLIPLKTGERSLSIPLLKLDFGGYKIAFPKYQFNVKALPVYLNPDTLVGNIKIELLSKPAYWLQHQSLYRFKFVVTAYGIPAEWMPPATTWLKSRTYARYYPQRVKIKTDIDHSGLVTRMVVEAALVPKKTGRYTALESTLRYFDPERSQWVNKALSKGQWFAAPAWIYWLLYAVAILIVLYGVWVVAKYLLGLFCLWGSQWPIRRKIKQATRHSECQSLLSEVLEKYGINSALPEIQLYQCWLERYGPNRSLQSLLMINSQQKFKPQRLKPGENISQYKEQLNSMLRFLFLLSCYHKSLLK